jgi:hypothetical protein
MIIAWTGHRPDLFLDPAEARATVESTARKLLLEQPSTRFLVGGQRGVDIWAALAAIAAGVPFGLVLPSEVDTFTQDWHASDQALLRLTFSHASDVRVADGYSARNQLLAQTADLLVAIWTGTSGGGTAETLTLARAAGTPIREIVLAASPTARKARGRGI